MKMKGLVALLLQRMIALYMDDCRVRNLRPKTMDSYEKTLQLLARWLREEQGIDRWESVRETHIRAYVRDLQERGKYTYFADEKALKQFHLLKRRDKRQMISVITINNYLRNIRVFFNWLEESECIRKSPMRKVREIPQERPPKEYLEDEEVLRLLKSMDRAYFSEYRDMLVMMLMLDAGTRLGETLSAELEQLNIEKRSLYLPADKTKGRKERTVYFSEKTARELRHWLQYKDRYCESPYLFPVRHTGRKVQVSA